MPRFLGLVVGALAVMLFALQGGQAFAAHVTCGDVITQDTTLDSDLVDCPGDGLVIGADGVTLDLGGHIVDGTGTGCGIANGHHECVFPVEDGYERVIVRNGAVSQFYHGVGVTEADDNALLGLRVRNCDAHGLSLFEASGTLIEGNVVSGSGSGIFLEADGNTIRRNRFSQMAATGSSSWTAVATGSRTTSCHKTAETASTGSGSTTCSWRTTSSSPTAATGCTPATARAVTASKAIGSRATGSVASTCRRRPARTASRTTGCSGTEVRVAAGALYIGDGDENVIGNNHISENVGGAAILLEYGTRNNVIAANYLARNSGDGIVLLADGGNDFNLIEVNHLSRNGGDGIRIEAGAIGNVVRRNHAVGNTDDGMDSDSAFTTFARNMAVRNGDLGIEAVPGAIDGGGNRASSNGNPLQCLFVGCR